MASSKTTLSLLRTDDFGSVTQLPPTSFDSDGKTPDGERLDVTITIAQASFVTLPSIVGNFNLPAAVTIINEGDITVSYNIDGAVLGQPPGQFFPIAYIGPGKVMVIPRLPVPITTLYKLGVVAGASSGRVRYLAEELAS